MAEMERNADGRRAGEGKENREPEMVIANEFATVIVSRHRTRNGTRLKIYAPKLNQAIYLDAVMLESLIGKPLDTFSDLLE
mgnify:CR=1 FL=1